MSRIVNGERVVWRAAYEHEGEIIALIPVGASLLSAARPHMQGLAWVAMCTDLARRRVQEIRSQARYLVRCKDDRGQTVYRAPLAVLVEKQNPQAKREGPR